MSFQVLSPKQQELEGKISVIERYSSPSARIHKETLDAMIQLEILFETDLDDEEMNG